MNGSKDKEFLQTKGWKILIPLILLGTVWCFLVVLFIYIARHLLIESSVVTDEKIAALLRSFESAELTRAAIIVTTIGSAPIEYLIVLLIVIGMLFSFPIKHYAEPLALICCLFGVRALNKALKAFFHRERPDLQHLIEVEGFSFPSGHAMISAAFYGMIGYLLFVNLREKSILSAWFAVVLTALLIVAIGASRIYLGVHYASDVLAGFAAGGAWLIFCIVGLNFMKKYFRGGWKR